MVKVLEHPIKMEWFGGTPIFGNTYIFGGKGNSSTNVSPSNFNKSLLKVPFESGNAMIMVQAWKNFKHILANLRSPC